MSLIGNYFVLNKTPAKWLAGTTGTAASGSGMAQIRGNWNRPADWYKFGLQDSCGTFKGTVVTDNVQILAAKPSGYNALPSGSGLPAGYLAYAGSCWGLPRTGGAMSTSLTLVGNGSVATLAGVGPNLAGGLNGVATLTGAGNVTNAAMTLLIYGSSTLTGSGTITAAVMALGNAGAGLTGSGTLTAALTALGFMVSPLSGAGDAPAPVIMALGNGSAGLTGSGTVNSAVLSALGNVLAALTGSGTVNSANLSGALQASAGLTGAGNLTAALGALMGAVAALSGAGDTSGTATARAAATAALTGSGTPVASCTALGVITGAASGSGTVSNANATGAGQLTGPLVGAGDLTAAIKALGNALATLAGSGDISASASGTLGAMSAAITSQGTLSPDSLAAAVWNSLAASFDAPGTFGALLNDGGGSGPTPDQIAQAVWALANAIETGITPTQAVRAILATNLGAAAGGGAVGPISFKSPDGSTTRVTLNVTDTGGNRTNPTLNL